MPPRKKTAAAPALTDGDVADLRTRLGAGERPRVVVRAASAAVPAGTRGNVIRLGDPKEGEFIVVRLGRDEVPFAPSELALPTRARSGAATAPAPAARKAGAATPAVKRAPAARGATTTARGKATDAPAGGEPRSAARATRAARRAVPSTPPVPAPAERTRRARSSRRAAPPLTVTLRFTDDQWTVEAARGARRLARPSPVRPGAVKAFADLVDDPDVRAAMSETVESSRAVVARRAEELRAELEAAEAALRDYEARRR